MIDIHTHILPEMDDGAKSCEISLQMLQMEYEQGVTEVALTPHFYHERESVRHFLHRRAECYEKLCEAIENREKDAPALPRLILGAEVAWVPGLADLEQIEELCYEGSHSMLLELPFFPWNQQMLGQIYDLENACGVTPVIAHFERYFPIQTPGRLRDILQLGVPIQIGSDSLNTYFSRKKMLRMLQDRQVHFVASDCHNVTSRKPEIAAAMEQISHKLGDDFLAQMQKQTERLLCT